MIRVAGNQPPPPPMEEEAPMGAPPQAPPQEDMSMHTANKEIILEAMGLIQQALMMLMEVVPQEGEEEDPNMDAEMMPEDEGSEEEPPV